MKQEQLIDYLGSARTGFLARKDELRSEGRIDESTFEQIKANVCEICLSIWRKGDELYGGQQEAVARFFRQQLDHLTKQWTQAQTTAAAHQDEQNSHIEAIKLTQIEAIRRRFETNGSEQHD